MILGGSSNLPHAATGVSRARFASAFRPPPPHRSHCDRIIVLDKGRVAEIGSHNELIALGGLYCRMWASQQAEEDEAADRGEDLVLA